MNNLYVVFEGNDGAGKSTIMQAVVESLKTRPDWDTQIESVGQPGSTPLGKHVRQLVKYPETFDPEIEIDSLSLQTLYMVDAISFVKQRLVPALKAGRSVFSDRSSFVSALVYGIAEGLDLSEVGRLLQLITPPKMDRLYILQCPWGVGKQRLAARSDPDRFERKPADFFKKVEDTYDHLFTGSEELTLLLSKFVSPRDVVYVDSTLPLADVTKFVVSDLMRSQTEK